MRTISVFGNVPTQHQTSKFSGFLRGQLREFLFSPDSDRWLTILRIGLGIEIVLYSLSLRDDWNLLFARSNTSFLSREFCEALLSIQSPFIPRIGWIISLGEQVGLSEQTTLLLAWLVLFGSGFLLVIGVFCRSSAIAAWLLHLCAAKSGEYMAYGMDNFTTIGLFYLMIAPLPDRYALDWKIWKRRRRDLQILGFHRKVLQCHLCAIYFFGGITKCLGAGWWNGNSMWRALTRPPFDVISIHILIMWKPVLLILGIIVCLIETGFPFFIWSKRTRLIWLLFVLGMHAAIGLTMGLYLFSLVMIVLDLAAFGPGAEARWPKRRVTQRSGSPENEAGALPERAPA
jgi:Vitamin K-dependent gamma-carboxylase